MNFRGMQLNLYYSSNRQVKCSCYGSHQPWIFQVSDSGAIKLKQLLQGCSIAWLFCLGSFLFDLSY